MSDDETGDTYEVMGPVFPGKRKLNSLDVSIARAHDEDPGMWVRIYTYSALSTASKRAATLRPMYPGARFEASTLEDGRGAVYVMWPATTEGESDE